MPKSAAPNPPESRLQDFRELLAVAQRYEIAYLILHDYLSKFLDKDQFQMISSEWNTWKHIVLTYQPLHGWHQRINFPVTDYVSSLFVDNTGPCSKAFSLKVYYATTNNIFFQVRVEPNTVEVYELAHRPMPLPTLYTYVVQSDENPLNACIKVRVGTWSPEYRHLIYSHPSHTLLTSLRNTFAVWRPDSLTVFRNGLEPPAQSLQDVQNELRHVPHPFASEYYYTWMEYAKLLQLSADAFPDLISSLIVFNPSAHNDFLRFATPFLSQHSYTIAPGANVIELFWTEIYRLEPSQFRFRWNPNNKLVIRVRVGWVAGVAKQQNYHNRNVLVASDNQHIYLRHRFWSRFRPLKDEAALVLWLWLCELLWPYEHPISEPLLPTLCLADLL